MATRLTLVPLLSRITSFLCKASEDDARAMFAPCPVPDLAAQAMVFGMPMVPSLPSDGDEVGDTD